jgi:hypothetical protein
MAKVSWMSCFCMSDRSASQRAWRSWWTTLAYTSAHSSA